MLKQAAICVLIIISFVFLILHADALDSKKKDVDSQAEKNSTEIPSTLDDSGAVGRKKKDSKKKKTSTTTSERNTDAYPKSTDANTNNADFAVSGAGQFSSTIDATANLQQSLAANTAQFAGTGSINEQMVEWAKQNPEMRYLLPRELGGRTVIGQDGKQQSEMVQPGKWPGGPWLTHWPDTLKAAGNFRAPSQMAGMLDEVAAEIPNNGDRPSNVQEAEHAAVAAHHGAKTVQMPGNAAQAAQAAQQGQGIAAGNDMGDVAKNQAACAIDYCSKFMQNFTVEDGNKWNKVRNELFVPIGLLLLLPGAVLTQVKAIANAGNPVLDNVSSGATNPFEGILRSVICVFLIPATYLIVNWGIDLSNSITYTIANEYQRIFSTNIYKDAVCAEMKAFPTRGPNINNNTGIGKNWPQGQVKSQADFEKYFLENKKEDPCSGLHDQQNDKQDEGMPGGAMAARAISFTGNAGLTATWNVLCAFQMAYLFYLFFVGPVVAGLWAWPITVFRAAFPNWVEGVATICFWSLFWNTTILLMACFKGVDESGTIITTALNFLATASVKYAFDFAGLVKAAGAEATKAASQGGKDGSTGSKGSSGSAGSQGKSGSQNNASQDESGAQAASGRNTGVNIAPGADQPIVAAGPTRPAAPVLPDTNLMTMLGLGSAAPLARRDDDTSIPAILGIAPPLTAESPARTLPGESFVVGDGAEGHMFTRALDQHGKPVLNVSTTDGTIIGSLSLDGMNEGDRRTLDFDGGTVTAEQGNGDNQLYTASSHGHTEMVAFGGGHLSGHSGPAVPGGMHPTMIAGKPAVEIASGLFVGQDGKSFYDIDHNLISIDGSGRGILADGRTFEVSALDGNTNVNLFSPSHEFTSAYAINANNGSVSIAHTDSYHRPVESFLLKPDSSGVLHSSLMNASGQQIETADLSGANIVRSYFDPNTQARLGFSSMVAYDNGSSVTNFYRDDNSLVGTNQYQLTDDGFREVVFDGAGSPVEMQQTAYTPAGYSVSSASFIDGNITNANIAQYDNSGMFITRNPLDSGAAAALCRDITSTATSNHVSAPGDLSRLSLPAASESRGGVVPDGQVFGQTSARTTVSESSQRPVRQVEVANNYTIPVTSSRVDVVPPTIGLDSTSAAQPQPHVATNESDRLSRGAFELIAQNESRSLQSQLEGRPNQQQSSPVDIANLGTNSNANELTRKEVVEQSFTNTVIAAKTQMNVTGEVPFDAGNRSSSAPSVMPKRGLGAIYSDITLGKKTANFGTSRPKPVDDVSPPALVRKTQSLEDQMVAAGQAQPSSANRLNQALNKTNASAAEQMPGETLTAAKVHYRTIASLLHEGNSHEAALIANQALLTLKNCAGTEPELLPLVRLFIAMFEQKNMTEQARTFQLYEEMLKNRVVHTARV